MECFAHVGIFDAMDFAIGKESVDVGIWGGGRIGDNMLDDFGPSTDWTEDEVVGALHGDGVVLFSVLLIFECDGDVVCGLDGYVGMF